MAWQPLGTITGAKLIGTLTLFVMPMAWRRSRSRGLADRRQQVKAELLGLVVPRPAQGEAGIAGHRGELPGVELVRVLCVNRLVCREVNFKVEGAQANRLRRAADQMHFDAPFVF